MRNPSPDSPDYKDYPIYDYLRKVGAEVAFPVNIPSDWKPRVYDGNRMTHRGAGERKPFNSPADWKKRVYDSWHNLWILHLVTMDTGSMWQWSHHLNASTFFFKPWKVTRVGTVQVAEAGMFHGTKLHLFDAIHKRKVRCRLLASYLDGNPYY